MTTSQHTFIIAEAGVNHNGSLDMAIQLIDAAAEAGADAVKFQTFKAEAEISRTAEKADYQKGTTGAEESQLEMVRKLELDLEAHRVLVAHCRARNIEFLSTPFDLGSVQLLHQDLGVRLLKVASGEVTHGPLMLAMARTGCPLLVSLGMAILGEIEEALGTLAWGYLNPEGEPSTVERALAYASPEGQTILRQKVTLLHCTTEYPTPFEDANLRVIDTLRQAFGLAVGFSDHTPGIVAPLAAVARGASVIEKHFTLDRNLPGPDHQASLEPGELRAMVAGIRQVEAALGSPVKVPAPSEVKNIPIARKSIVAARPIRKGETYTNANLTCKRPGTGISPMRYWELLGQPADRDYEEDQLIQIVR